MREDDIFIHRQPPTRRRSPDPGDRRSVTRDDDIVVHRPRRQPEAPVSHADRFV